MSLFSSPEPSDSQGELIVYPCSCVRRRRPQCSTIFSSKSPLPIIAKFYVEPPWEVGGQSYINGRSASHMAKMAAMPIYGNNLQNRKSYDLETWHAASGTQALQFVYNCDPWLTMTNFTASSDLVTHAFLWEK